MQVDAVLVAASANRCSSCSALLPSTSSSSSSLVFGSGKYLALWDVAGRRGVKRTLRGHGLEVTAVERLETTGGRDFASGDAKGEVRLWRSSSTPSRQEQWTSISIKAHEKSISALASIFRPTSQDQLLLTASSDTTVKLWRIVHQSGDEQAVDLVDEVSLGNNLALGASFARLGADDRFVLAIGTTSSKVAVYTVSDAGKLSLAVSLSGHTDWVRCVDFQPAPPAAESDLLLATGSQDSFIRLWRFTPTATTARSDVQPVVNGDSQPPKTKSPFEALDALEASLSDNAGSSSTSKAQRIEMKKHAIRSGSLEWGHVSAEAVLPGHENWVTDVRWCPASASGSRLLSTSVDRSMILWTAPETADGLWLSSDRFGELSASTNLGFFGAHFAASSTSANEVEVETAMASGWGGAWHVWRRRRTTAAENWGGWEPIVAPTGHVASVTGLDWDAKGEILLTSSMDQTTRLWGPWRKDDAKDGKEGTWHELARPQIHGHDIFDVRFVGSDRRTAFVSVGEEKVIRAFEATSAFVRSVGPNGMRSLDTPLEASKRAETAMVPALGLSNRVVADGAGDGDAVTDAVTVDQEVKEGLKHPPFEDQLLSSTLWPEVDKLFGHSSELLTVAASPTSTLFASACQSNTAKHASVRVWDAADWRPVGRPLEFHTLSVTRFAFGRVEEREVLVSVSRDRGWAVWVRGDDGTFTLLQGRESAHTRIIYDVAWNPVGSTFATASRDKTVKLWSRQGEQWDLAATIKFPVGVRSVAFAPLDQSADPSSRVLLAVGLEDGRVVCYSAEKEDAETWREEGELDPSLAHVDAVSRIAFCPRLPTSTDGGRTRWRLATASEDKTVRIVDVSF